jgi:hypothetical protein
MTEGRRKRVIVTVTGGDLITAAMDKFQRETQAAIHKAFTVPAHLLRPNPAPRRCRVCGCTENHACITPAGPRWWIASDLCSGCAEEVQ